MTFALIIWSNLKIKGEEEQTLGAVARTDRYGLILQVIAFVVIVTVLLIL
jgi:hypothetical protein